MVPLGDVADGVADLAHLGAALAEGDHDLRGVGHAALDALHGLGGPGDGAGTVAGGAVGLLGQARGGLAQAGDALRALGHLSHRRRHAGRGLGVLLRAPGHLVDPGGDLADGHAGLLRARAMSSAISTRLRQESATLRMTSWMRPAKSLNVPPTWGELVGAVHIQAHGQVTVAHLGEALPELRERAGGGPGDEQRRPDAGVDREADEHEQQHLRGRERGLRVGDGLIGRVPLTARWSTTAASRASNAGIASFSSSAAVSSRPDSTSPAGGAVVRVYSVSAALIVSKPAWSASPTMVGSYSFSAFAVSARSAKVFLRCSARSPAVGASTASCRWMR